MASVAIIGAGMSGLSAAHVLQDNGHQVMLFEKSQEISGRAATQARAGFIYDDGAQYIKGGSPLSTAWITQRFYADGLLDIQKPVWIFDQQGHIAEGDPAQNADPKWNYCSGLTTLAKQMAARLNILLGTAITRIQQADTGWNLFSLDGSLLGRYDSVVITIPAPQALALIEVSTLAQNLRDIIVEKLGQAVYNPLISVALGYQSRPQTRPYYALVNTDKAHAISWLAWEHEKAVERVPNDAGLLIAQMSPTYSCEHWDMPRDELIRDVAARVTALLSEPLTEPMFNDIAYWQYALPSAKANAHALNATTIPAGLAFCGDAFVGGRVHLALEHGVEVAGQLCYKL